VGVVVVVVVVVDGGDGEVKLVVAAR